MSSSIPSPASHPPEIYPCLFIGFVGHRMLANPEQVKKRIAAELVRLRDEYASRSAPEDRRKIAAISSIASGADMLFAEAALETGIEWLVYLPFPAEEFSKDFSEADWTRAKRALDNAIFKYTGPALEPQTAPVKANAQRIAAYSACGQRIADECDVLIAVIDRYHQHGPGGTNETFIHARASGRRCIIIEPDTPKTKEYNALEFETPPRSRLDTH